MESAKGWGKGVWKPVLVMDWAANGQRIVATFVLLNIHIYNVSSCWEQKYFDEAAWSNFDIAGITS